MNTDKKRTRKQAQILIAIILSLLFLQTVNAQITYTKIISQESGTNGRGYPRCQSFTTTQTGTYGDFRTYINAVTSNGDITWAIYNGTNMDTSRVPGCQKTINTAGNCAAGDYCAQPLGTGACVLEAGRTYYACWNTTGVLEPYGNSAGGYAGGCEHTITGTTINGCTSYDWRFQIYNISGYTPIIVNYSFKAYSDNGTQIMDYNATVNGTYYTSDVGTGNLVTKMTPTPVKSYNITLRAPGIYTTFLANQNTSISNYSLTPLNILSGTIAIADPPFVYTATGIQLSVNKSGTLAGNIYGLATTYRWNISRNVSAVNTLVYGNPANYTISGNDYANLLTYTVKACNAYICSNATRDSSYIANSRFVFNAYGLTGLLQDVLWTINALINSGNPTLTPAELGLDFTNTTAIYVTYAVKDTNGFYYEKTGYFTLRQNQTYYNTTLTAVPLVFYFKNQSGAAVETKGTVSGYLESQDWKTTYYFNTTEVLLLKKNFTELSKIYITYGEHINGNETQFSQYFEFENNPSYNANITLTVIDEPTEPITFIVYATNRKLIDSAIVTYYQAEPIYASWIDYKMVGQKFTDNTGRAYGFFKKGKPFYYTVNKAGYTPYISQVIYPGDDATEYTVTLDEIQNKLEEWAITTPPYYDNTTMKIPILAYHPQDINYIKTRTSYNPTINRTIYNQGQGIYQFNLTAGTDYSQAAPANFTLYVYANGQEVGRKQITYIDKPSLIGFPFTYDNLSSIPLLLWILLILIITAAVSFGMEGHDTGPVTYIVMVFIVASINQNMLWTALLNAILIGAKIIEGVTSK